MALSFVEKWFSRVGRGVPQTPQVDTDTGAPILKDGEPVLGNEQYKALQLTDESIDSESADTFMADVLEATSGDLKLAAKCFRNGFNKDSRLKAGGLDEYQKAAKKVMDLGLPWAKGLSIDEVAAKLKAMS